MSFYVCISVSGKKIVFRLLHCWWLHVICGSSDLHCHYTLFSNSLFSPLSTHSLKLILATFHISSGSKLLTYLVFNVAEKDSSFCLCTRLSSTVHCYLHYKSLTTSEPKFTSSQNYQIRLLHYGLERRVTLIGPKLYNTIPKDLRELHLQ